MGGNPFTGVSSAQVVIVWHIVLYLSLWQQSVWNQHVANEITSRNFENKKVCQKGGCTVSMSSRVPVPSSHSSVLSHSTGSSSSNQFRRMVFHKSPFENGHYHHHRHSKSHHHHHQTLYSSSLRSNQSMVLPGMGIIGRSVKFEVICQAVTSIRRMNFPKL